MKILHDILLVEDNPGDARLLQEMVGAVEGHDIALVHVESMREAETYLAAHTVDMILLDLGLPDCAGLEAIKRAHAAAAGVPLVVLTGLDDDDVATQALQQGAQDFLIKGEVDVRGLSRALRYAYERSRLERLKDEFVGTVSHELRTPLTSISGALGLLMTNAAGELPEPAKRILVIAHSNCLRLVRLVNDILDMDKSASGLVEYIYDRVNVLSLVEKSLEANRGFADGHRVGLRLEDAGSVRDVRADPDRLTQAITNLLSNAIKFSPADQDVVVKIENVADVVRISVRNYGLCIPTDFKPLIFERFAQADATNTRHKGGTGLGLSIVKQIVERLGGKVGFDDAVGGGTIFHIELPAWQELSASAGRAPTAGQASAPMLVVDPMPAAKVAAR